VALGLRLPVPGWWPREVDPVRDTASDPSSTLAAAAPRRGSVATAPTWHRLHSPDAVHRLDPGLEGWERTRAILEGHPLR
jgi:hypothetical protein